MSFGLRGCVLAIALIFEILARPVCSAAQSSSPCIGDCAVDGQVTVDEIVVGVSIALGQLEIDRCSMFDRSRDGDVTVDEILAAVAAALGGCTPNRPPTTEDLPDYVTYPEREVRVVVPGSDPDEDALGFTAEGLPAGAMLDATSGVLTWQPSAEDVGSHVVSYLVTDSGFPPLSASGAIRFEVMQPKPCQDLDCLPATGCTALPLDISVDCCPAPPEAREEEPLLDCPAGAIIALGRNREGFGPLQDCDTLPLVSQGQGGTTVSMHIAARCIRTDAPSSMRIQLYTADNVLVNFSQASVSFGAAANGFFAQRNRRFEVDDSTVEPQFFEGDEAQLAMTIQDADGLFLEKTIRVRLTLGPAEDLPDINSPSLPSPES
jgi:hypothetical protein